MIKAYLHCCFDEEDSFEDELDHYVMAKLAYLKSSRYVFCSPYQTWNSNWEWMLYDSAYMADDEFFANFCMDTVCILQLNSLVEDDEAFSNYKGRWAINVACHGVSKISGELWEWSIHREDWLRHG